MVSCELPDELRKAEDAARNQAVLDKEVLIEMQSARGGILQTDVRRAYLRDFFSKVQVADLGRGFSLDFYPAENADPFWRDVMVRILRATRDSASGISIKRIERASQ
jgi:hypothetical protein